MRVPTLRLLLAALVAALALSACGSSSTGTAAGDSTGTAAEDDGHGDDGHSTAEEETGDGHATAEQAPAPVDGAPAVTLTAIDIDYEPATLELAAGQPTNVTVVNEGEALHDFTLEEAGVHLNVEAGESKTAAVVVDEPGKYTAICTVPGHADAGMTVDVVVSE